MFLFRKRSISTERQDLTIQERKEDLLRDLILRETKSMALFDRRDELIRQKLLLSWTRAVTVGGAVGILACVSANFCRRQFNLSKTQVTMLRAAWGFGICTYITRSYFLAKYEALDRLAKLHDMQKPS